MAYRRIVAGSTSQLTEFPIYDSTSTTGALKSGLTYSSMTACYYREGAAGSTSMSLATMTMGTWTSLGFVAVDGTNMPGVYQLGIPNAAIAAGATQVTIYLTASGCVPVVIPIELTSVADYPANMTQIAGSSVSTGSAQLGVNAVQIGGSAPGSATIGTVTNLTNAPTSGDLTTTMKASVTAAVPTVAQIQTGLPTDSSIQTDCYNALNTAYTDATSLNTYGVLDRLRWLCWLIRNEIDITDSTGAGVLKNDSGTVVASSWTVTDSAGTTTRTRVA
ncbi:MAG: hypothetical protein ACLPXB_05075 [Thiobacillaceae bacterium]